MRILIKGGVWKNTEDEILKAAVMKYGLNQWARISSLLVRKSAKQCKARWYEWLDPSIKKTEWSREEEEKLLHLAKLMPTQWRTIAPIVGRTAAQCLEHYEKLLDAAQQKEEGYDPSEDPRRLRPGEIDPTPEAKPARPDPVDMDEDEKEMLSEAKARLANTKGKKAKRKAREKQLEEARRLAALQKRRELKAAGIDLPQRKRKQKGIDYMKEIPFHKQVPAGFYDTAGEIEAEQKRRADPNFVNIALQRLEARRRDEEEDRRRKKDSAKHQIKKVKDLPAFLMQVNKLTDPEQVRQRTKLKLPEPQISDSELEEIAKLGYTPTDLIEGDDDARKGATKTLLGDYSATPTPFRSPGGRTPAPRTALGGRTPARQDTVMLEAQNLIALTSTQTPLMGGENTPLHPSDFSGATPRRMDIQTPNPLATPLHASAGKGVSSTPMRKAITAGAATPLRTPLRDELSINEGDSMAVDDPRAERQRELAIRSQLKMGLSALPEPSNEYKIMMPELPEEEEEGDLRRPMEEDAADTLARDLALAKAKEESRMRLRSQVLKRGLPRPLGIAQPFLEDGPTSEGEEALNEEMIKKEMVVMLTHDAIQYPIKGIKPPSSVSTHYEEFTEQDMDTARSLLRSELDEVKRERGNVSFALYAKAEDELRDGFVFVPAKKRFVSKEEATKEDLLNAVKHKFEFLKAHNKAESTKAAALEKKLGLYNGGYENRATTLEKEIGEMYEQLTQSQLELQCFEALRARELDAIQKRTAVMQENVKEQIERENDLQRRYANLLADRESVAHSRMNILA